MNKTNVLFQSFGAICHFCSHYRVPNNGFLSLTKPQQATKERKWWATEHHWTLSNWLLNTKWCGHNENEKKMWVFFISKGNELEAHCAASFRHDVQRTAIMSLEARQLTTAPSHPKQKTRPQVTITSGWVSMPQKRCALTWQRKDLGHLCNALHSVHPAHCPVHVTAHNFK